MRTDQSRSTPTSRLLPLFLAIFVLGAPLAGAEIHPLADPRPVTQGSGATCPVVSAGGTGYVVGWQQGGAAESSVDLHLRSLDEVGRLAGPVADIGTTTLLLGAPCADLEVVAEPGGASLAFWRKTQRSGTFATTEHQILATPVGADGVAATTLPASGAGGGLPRGIAAAGPAAGTTLGAWRNPSAEPTLAVLPFDSGVNPLEDATQVGFWRQPQAAVLDGQLFLVAGESQGDPGPTGSLAGQLVGPGGDPLGPAFTIHDDTARVVSLAQGGFVAAWVDGTALALRTFTSDGRPTGPVRNVSSEDDSNPFQSPGYEVDEIAVASVPLASGRSGPLVLAWRQTRDVGGETVRQVFARTVATDGTPLGPKVAVSQAHGDVSGPVLASAAPGSVLAAWSLDCAACPQPGVFARAFAVTPGVTKAGVDDRFEIDVQWRDFQGNAGSGVSVPFSDDTVAFWFFRPGNLELMVKVLDGRPVNGNFWVFGGALSSVEYTITVTDTATGAERVYENTSGNVESFADTAAFPGG